MEQSIDTYRVDQTQCGRYQSDGFIKLNGVFGASEIEGFERAVTAGVDALYDPATQKPPNSDTSAYEQAFNQVMNIWCSSESVRALIFNPVLARIAAELMGVSGVRLYHDQALYKAPGGGFTPWHCDQYYWPLDSDNTITAWIPLQDTPLEMGALAFSAGSHLIDLGRDLPIGEGSQQIIDQRLKALELEQVANTFRAGDVSFHSGWTFHRAGGNTTGLSRRAMTIIYMADGTRLKAPANDNQKADWEQWCPGARVGEAVATPLNPLLYSKDL
ncbi:MAG: ectoine hydroxylase-related dioxygenase (phytanoyl-CoA dioxygenase family) [Bacteroidia bacterium]|jgi:ectoine hydroxylase-related dioxygenase (phytanoyl-CoA dioxygenase family)